MTDWIEGRGQKVKGGSRSRSLVLYQPPSVKGCRSTLIGYKKAKPIGSASSLFPFDRLQSAQRKTYRQGADGGRQAFLEERGYGIGSEQAEAAEAYPAR
jgi:hypothetical protein